MNTPSAPTVRLCPGIALDLPDLEYFSDTRSEDDGTDECSNTTNHMKQHRKPAKS